MKSFAAPGTPDDRGPRAMEVDRVNDKGQRKYREKGKDKGKRKGK